MHATCGESLVQATAVNGRIGVIRRVSLSQFKSVGSQESLDLANLTVLTGANSSGKSTLLQSMLVLAQTILHAGSDRQLVLNGPLTRLGQFDEVLNQVGEERTFSIGLEIAPARGVENQRSDPQRLIRRVESPTFVKFECAFTDKPLTSSNTTEASSFPLVDRCSAEVFFDLGSEHVQRHQLSVKRHPWTLAKRMEREGVEPDDAPPTLAAGLTWKVAMDATSRDSLTDEGVRPDLRGATFDHFLPSALVSKYDVNEEIARIVVDLVAGRRSSAAQIGDQLYVFGALWAGIRPCLPDDYDGPTEDDDVRASDLRDWMRSASPAVRRRVSKNLRDNRSKIIHSFAESMASTYWLRSTSLPQGVRRGLAVVHAGMSGLRYVGPLRVQPSPIYPVAATLGSRDVGPSGEWTASVLDEYKDAEVTYIPPSELPFEDQEAALTTTSLIEAVDQWLQYLGVSKSVQTIDRGSLGHELRVAGTEGDKHLPLTHVGVGVSQCLPVVVSLLLAPKGSITLLEQPELHLHPAVQSRLADFLLAMSLSDRQCLVETHSEYLVNRLRLRVAQGRGNSLNSDVALYFAELVDGTTRYSEVEINEYGVIENWPTGFFDQTQDDTEELLVAGMMKRKVGRVARDN